MTEDRNSIAARIEEINDIINEPSLPEKIRSRLLARKSELYSLSSQAQEPILSSIVRSHKAICAAKNMNEKAAYGNDPAVYYSLGICGEAGELANNIVKSLRNGWDRDRILEAVKGELPDVIIYSYVLAYVLDIDLTSLVNEKVEIVINRANVGYYGGEIK